MTGKLDIAAALLRRFFAGRGAAEAATKPPIEETEPPIEETEPPIEETEPPITA